MVALQRCFSGGLEVTIFFSDFGEVADPFKPFPANLLFNKNLVFVFFLFSSKEGEERMYLLVDVAFGTVNGCMFEYFLFATYGEADPHRIPFRISGG